MTRKTLRALSAVSTLALTLTVATPISASAPDDSVPPKPTLETNKAGETYSVNGSWEQHPDAVSASTPSPGESRNGKADPLIDNWLDASSGIISAGDCRYRQHVDNVHTSANGVDASVHGWWTDENNDCPTLANVDVLLQGYWCDDFFGCQWRTVDSASEDVKARNFRGGTKVNARQRCATSQRISWRGEVDVDLIGQNDPSGYTRSTIVNLNCAPS